ncbi:hypothetical protein PSA7680_01926 [Pseudoruegeria aquimaris]|uniref:LytTR family transcriptional regulator n=1 Tax=Pseudoruegeria aquimaris TaxID=393663 RepID=A0A1Y5SET8_9RHOB|nr:DUF4159 domain-containing protein [Pseudoruegeria aquimaris]SLN39163.1 hypothetical protein PSA7680_01926 [Pseudoruegeria aquimaris]
MLVLGPIGFTAPWLLLGLLVLPVLWILLRVVPPAPIRRRFPGVVLLLGLKDEESETDRTPWWLLLLRLAAVAALILGFSGPVLNPQPQRAGEGPLLIVMDGTWASAQAWPRRIQRAEALLEEAGRAGRSVAVVTLTELPPAGDLPFQSADAWKNRLAGVSPKAHAPSAAALADWGLALPQVDFETYWISDGLAREGRETLLAALQTRGAVTVFQPPTASLGLRPAIYADGVIEITVLRDLTAVAQSVSVAAIGLDPAGTERALASGTATFDAGAGEAVVTLALPPELRNRVSRFTVAGVRSAGAVALTDDALKRREVALIAGREDREGLELLSPLHYLRQALAPTADLLEGGLTELLPANPDAIILADVATLAPAEAAALLDWVEAGGLLLRFAGPRLAASDVSRAEEDPLMPVRLREGGRTVGGAMSWGAPKRLRAFTDGSPFFGLPVPREVEVSAQVLAQPDPELASRTIAVLEDGTPLVTRKPLGDGQVVLFHVTANAEWSSLPLSGLFVQMLERLAVSTRPDRPSAEDLAGTSWQPVRVLDAFGGFAEAGALAGVAGEVLAAGQAGPTSPPGLYASGDRAIALNVLGPEATLARAEWPVGVPVEGLAVAREFGLKGPLLAAALALLLLDILASLLVGGRLSGLLSRGTRTAAFLLAAGLGALFLQASPLAAQQAEAPAQAAPSEAAEALALAATRDVVLAHVVTGDPALDRVAQAGLRGLGRTLRQRTAIEPAEPIAVNLETDELAFFPFLYWPVSENQPLPSDEAYAKLNRYLRTGGMILFDTRDADVSGYAGQTPQARRLQQLAAPLDIPPLEQIPADHVLTRTFYLLQDFPGRHAGREVWVEAAPPDAVQIEGMPFRNLNDGVTPVVIGGNDWASAWAIDESGNRLFPVGRGFGGEMQREIALRFGVNLVMHVLTGNYKSDQVHVPALLDRLGQ